MLGLFLPERRYASADTSYGPISVCERVGECPSQVGVLSKRRTDRAGFWHGGFFSPVLHCSVKNQVSTKIRVLPLILFS